MASLTFLVLPYEILSMVCEELGQQQDFTTLYNCALSAQSLADPALRTLYKYHELSPAFQQVEETDIRQRDQNLEQKWKQAEQSFRRWTLIWRSIIASSLASKSTYKPYCRYLRSLDFRNLGQMLEDPKFQNTIRRDFFKGNLSEFQFLIKEGRRQFVDILATTNAIGEAIVPETFQLEEISGNLSPGFLTRWIPHTPKLRSIVLFHGGAVANGAGLAIAENCEDFQALTIREWMGPEADEAFARFLDDMGTVSLREFDMISYNHLQKASFQALGRHKSLQELKLCNLSTEAVQNLNALKDCIELHTLVLDDNNGTTQMESEVFGQVVEWLSSCTKLRDLSIKRFFDGPAILAQVCSAPHVKLTRLSLEGYTVRLQTSGAFHTALSEQRTLESVSLKGNGEDTISYDLSLMVESLSQLQNLRELVLKDVSDEFEDEHIMHLASCLPNLEELWTSGGEVTANVLPILGNLNKLRSLTFYALTQFSAEAILDFLTNLDPETQKGFSMFLMAVDPDYNLDEAQYEVIQLYIKQNLEGRFDFVLWREAESSDSEDD